MNESPNPPEVAPEVETPELRLVIWPDPTLKYAVAPFPEEEVGTELVRKTAEAMMYAMYKHHGVGLAAPQVGVPFQIFVMDAFWHEDGTEKKPRVFLNPKVTQVGKGSIELTPPGEGCLSFPYGYRSPVARLDMLELEWLDFEGETHHEEFTGHESIIVQHELDHLMGFCFIDRLSKLKQDIAYRKAKKIRRKYKKGYEKAINEMKNAHRTPEYAKKRMQTAEAEKK